MFRSPSGFRVSLYSAAAVILAATLASLPGQAQFTKNRRETNANRRARIERQIQDTYSHRWEIGGGGGYLRFRSGQNLQRNNEVDFFTNLTYYMNPKLGITGELRGDYGNAKISNNVFNLPYRPAISEYPFMGGVTYRLRMQQRTAISVFGLAGVAIGKFDGDTKGISATQLGMWPSNARPAFSVGANYDINLYPNLAFRIAPHYSPTTFGSTIQNNLGVNAGVIYRFGRQK